MPSAMACFPFLLSPGSVHFRLRKVKQRIACESAGPSLCFAAPEVVGGGLAVDAVCGQVQGMADALVIRDPDILSGEPVFAGTRVPVRTLTDHLEAGDTIDTFLEDFPTVRRVQVNAFLKEARERVTAGAG